MEKSNKVVKKKQKVNNNIKKLIIHKIQECIGKKKLINNLKKEKIKLH
jgi:hypothetical protein